VYHALKDGNEFFGVFKKEKMIKNLAYVHINEKGIIKDISACKGGGEFFHCIIYELLFIRFCWINTLSLH